MMLVAVMLVVLVVIAQLDYYWQSSHLPDRRLDWAAHLPPHLRMLPRSVSATRRISFALRVLPVRIFDGRERGDGRPRACGASNSK